MAIRSTSSVIPRSIDLKALCLRLATGESWWETDLQTVAKDFLTTAPTMDVSAANKSGSSLPATRLPPSGVREWLVQEQVRSWLVAIFSRADPLRLMEVDLVMQIGKVREEHVARSSACIRVSGCVDFVLVGGTLSFGDKRPAPSMTVSPRQ